MSPNLPPLNVPAAAEQGAPKDTAHAAGAAPGEFHPKPRPLSPRGGALGPMVGTWSVRDAVETTFAERVPAYVAEIARHNPQVTNPGLAQFHDWVNQPGASTVNPANAPRYMVTVPGTSGGPTRKGDGSYAVTWLARVQMWLWGKAWRDVDDRLGMYLTATRLCLLQNGSLGGFARNTTWRGEAIAPVQAQSSTHTWGQATLEVLIHVDPVANAYAGPAVLDPNTATPDLTDITGSTVTVDSLAVD